VRASKFEVSPELVRQRDHAAARLLQSLERRGINLETFLALTNQTAEQVERIVAQASPADRRELVLETIADDRTFRSPTKRFRDVAR
jgi:FKBP-type peptidyl-prolyl cis-trans isomerase (trigger factor)